jgi:hypothetical protein
MDWDVVGTRPISEWDVVSVDPTPIQTGQRKKTTAQSAVDLVRPTVEMLGAVGGGALGFASPIPGGSILGAGLGYGGAKSALHFVDQLLGTEKPMTVGNALATGAHDFLVGGSQEAGGQFIAPYIAKGAGWVVDKWPGNAAKLRASRIATQAAGSDLNAIKTALKNAPEGETAAQATANINSPTWQAIGSRSAPRDPRFYGGGPLTPTQEQAATNALQGIAKGETQTAMRGSQENALQELNKRFNPVRELELDAANIAGIKKPALDAQAKRFGQAAADKVGDVRRFTAAGERAGERAASTTTVAGQPRVPGRYTYMGELEKRAEQVAQQAADASLPFGEAAKFAQAASDSLKAHGLKPLTAESVVGSVSRIARKPEFAGNKDVSAVMKRVANDVAEWTQNGGVIDAYALDSIRKNSVNGAIRELYPSADKNVQKELAAKLLANVKPVVIDAIEGAGGTGYRQYLKDYATGRQVIDQAKLGARAVELFRTNKKSFIDLVEGNSPDEVKKIFGFGDDGYNIAKQMSAESMSTLRSAADLTSRGIRAAEQANNGQEALAKILESNISRFKLPWGISPKTMAMNKVLDVLEHKAGTKTMNILAEGMKSGSSAEKMLSELPAKDRLNLLRLLQDPATYLPGVSAATRNAMSFDSANQ